MDEKRGGREYTPPTKEYIGFGLNVWEKYDEGNNDWLANDNNPNEWCVAYYETNLKNIQNILKSKLKPGKNQLYSLANDLNHIGRKVGIGVYCFQNFSDINGSSNNCVLMCRVNPKLVRIPESNPYFFVVNGNSNEIRPYRLLIKKDKLKNEEELRKKNYKKKKSEIKKIAQKVATEFNSVSTKTNIDKQTIKTLENMIVMGDLIKDEILIEKKENPDKFVDIDKTLKNEEDENFPICVLAKHLEDNGIVTAVEKSTNKEDINIAATNLQFLTNGLATKKKLDVHFDYGKEKNTKIINDPKEQQNFIEYWKKNLSEKLKVPIEDIIITNIREGSVIVDFIIKSNDDNYFDELIEVIKEVSVKNNVKISKINVQPVTSGIKLTPAMFDKRGNRESGWGVGEKRGGREYIPPTKGYKGYGLNVWEKYDGGNNDWLAHDNNPNEWCVAYHATNLKFVQSILETKLQPGTEQWHEKEDDLNHPGQKVGKGVYCSPDIKETESYGGAPTNGYKCVFMCRVNPKTVRISKAEPKYWVVNGNDNEIRPYRLLIKKVNENK